MTELLRCDVREATHVTLLDGSVEKIARKWGIYADGTLMKTFGCVTESGVRVSMFGALSYSKDESPPPPVETAGSDFQTEGTTMPTGQAKDPGARAERMRATMAARKQAIADGVLKKGKPMTPEIAARYGVTMKSHGTKKGERKSKVAKKAAGQRDWKAEWARRKKNAAKKTKSTGGWSSTRRAKFEATIAAKKSGTTVKRTYKMRQQPGMSALLAGYINSGKPAGKRGRPAKAKGELREIEVALPDGTTVTYVPMTVTKTIWVPKP